MFAQQMASQGTIELKTQKEIAVMRQAGQAVVSVLENIKKITGPGISTGFIDKIVNKEISSLGMKPAFLGYRGYPAAACISVNNELVHGIPSDKMILRDGDIVSVDVGVLHNGFYGDAAITIPVGNIKSNAKKLIEITKNSLDIAVRETKPGKRLGDISWAIQSYVEENGFSVVRDYVGHGIGRKLHEDPAVQNFGKPGTGVRLVPGMVLCFEPMVNEGEFNVRTLDDGWTVVTVDGKLCAHFEHMVAVTENGCEVLTKI